jgi:hypothetical protein
MTKKDHEDEKLKQLAQHLRDTLEGKNDSKHSRKTPRKNRNKDFIFYMILGVLVVIGSYSEEEKHTLVNGTPPSKTEKRPPLGMRIPPAPPRSLPNDSLEVKYDGNYMDFDHFNNPEDDDEWWEYFND